MKVQKGRELDISIVMPCLNEEAAVGFCVREAKRYIKRRGLTGEVIVADNGSTDASAAVAEDSGARVVYEKRRGYGNAIKRGVAASRGRVIIMGDCDTTYDFSDLDGFYELVRKGEYDIVIGNRFAGGIERRALPVVNRLGGKVLSAFGRLRYGVSVKDFHCGLRSFSREAARKLKCRSGGMEFATEMIAAAKDAGLSIGELPIRLRRCKRKRRSKLRPIRDGMRHLRYMVAGV